MRILIAGASGTIGTALVQQLSGAHDVHRLVRRKPANPDESYWDPSRGEIDQSAIEDADAVVNLSGAGIAGGLWTRSYKELLYSSRLKPTRTLVDAMVRAKNAPAVFISQSASGYYGDRGDEVLTESSSSGATILADICRRWEAEAHRAPSPVRVVTPRTGIVMTRGGGALPKLLLPLRLYGGGPIGSGQQWWPWITMTDQVRAMEFLLTAPIEGPVNLGAPEPAQVGTIVADLGNALHRPSTLRIPEKMLKVLGGRLAYELLLVSARMEPRVLTSAGFTFEQSTSRDLADWVRASLAT
ncbi:uncharacterized protein (TIGR01777 family) [Arthrobacter sp. CAN_A214]|uniref:TIGR01777 family oxidoreductase n=1 Tax=Arthrobacter sp. CAN_A214 TaxID=2787720 RepID=UPI0018CB7101